ncbi:MAG: hypothetical protein Q7S21_07185 [archaeon]|nr:hypothetical protein [archaeon]
MIPKRPVIPRPRPNRKVIVKTTPPIERTARNAKRLAHSPEHKFVAAMDAIKQSPHRFRGVFASQVELLRKLRQKFGNHLEKFPNKTLLSRYMRAAGIGAENLLDAIKLDSQALEKYLR